MANQTKALKALTSAISEEMGDLQSASDHAAALIATSFIAHQLRNALLRPMVKLGRDKQDELFEDPGPLSTLSSRIKLGYALGLYGSETVADLNRIRLIRNAFAHSGLHPTFNDNVIASACLNLTAIRRHVAPQGLIRSMLEARFPDTKARTIFIWTTAWYVNALKVVDVRWTSPRRENLEDHILQ